MQESIEISSHELRNNSLSFQAIGKLHADLQIHSNKEIVIDFKNVTWFDAHLAAALKTVISHSENLGNKHKYRNAQDGIEQILKKNGFWPDRAIDIYKTTMPVEAFSLDDSKRFALYAKRNLSGRGMPKMTEQLQRKFHEGIDELFANCSMHSQSSVKIIASGQVYPRKHLLTITLSDGGMGIIGALNNAGIKIRDHSEAINWAMQKDNTSRKGDIPGGLGLAVLREFVAKNEGQLIVASKKGFWCQKGRTISTKRLDYEFPGTCVILEINTADDNYYDLRTPIPAKDVW